MNNRLTDLREQLTTGFLGFWVRQYRISYLVVITLIIMGGLAVYSIPKESSPSVKLGIISVVTIYPGTSPVDMDSLISDKIYKEIKDIKGIDKIAISSSLGVSSLSVTLRTDANTKDLLNDIRNNVSKVILPTEAKAPTITEIETDTNRTFSIFLYSKDPAISKSLLFDRAIALQ